MDGAIAEGRVFGQAHRLEDRDFAVRLSDVELEDVRIEDDALLLSLAD